MRTFTILFTFSVFLLLGNAQAKAIRGDVGEIPLNNPVAEVIRVKRANGDTFTNSHIIHPGDYNMLTSDPNLTPLRAQNFMHALHVNDARLRRPGVNPNPLDERKVHSLIVGDPAQVHSSLNPVPNSNVGGPGVRNNVYESNRPFDVLNIRRDNNGDISRISHFNSPVAAGLDPSGTPVHYQSSYVGGKTTLFQRSISAGAGGSSSTGTGSTNLSRGKLYSSTPNLGGSTGGFGNSALGNMPNTFGSSNRQPSGRAAVIGTGSTNKGLGTSSTFGGSLTSSASPGSRAGVGNTFGGSPINLGGSGSAVNGLGGSGTSTARFGSFAGSGASSSSGFGSSSSTSSSGRHGATPNLGGSVTSSSGFRGSSTSVKNINRLFVSTPNLGATGGTTSILGNGGGGRGGFGSTTSIMGGPVGTSSGLLGPSSGAGTSGVSGMGSTSTANSGVRPNSSSSTSSGRGRGRGSTKSRGGSRGRKGK